MYNLLWQNDTFKYVFIRLGSVHTIRSFFGAIRKLMKGSDLAEIGICASGSIEQVFSGRHYNQALRVHKLVSEALEQLLLIKLTQRDSRRCLISVLPGALFFDI